MAILDSINERLDALRDEERRLENAKAILTGEHKDTSERRRERLNKHHEEKVRKAGKVSKRDKIMKLVDEGKSAKEVAAKVGCAVNYVYVVRRQSLKAA